MDTRELDEPPFSSFRLFSSSSSDSDSDYQVHEEPDEDPEDMFWGDELFPTKQETRRKAKPGNDSGARCHYCRQRTVAVHISCSRCIVKYCGPCLFNRNGENILVEMSSSAGWVCPRCRGGCGPGCITCCTCVPCRKLKGLEKTGQILRVARAAGFQNVHDYLVHQQTGETASIIASRKVGRGWTKASSPGDEDEQNPVWTRKKGRSARKRLVARMASKWIDEALAPRCESEDVEKKASLFKAVTGTSEEDGMLIGLIDNCETKAGSKVSRCLQIGSSGAATKIDDGYEDQQSIAVYERPEKSQIDGLSASSRIQHEMDGDGKDSTQDVPNATDTPIAVPQISLDGRGSSCDKFRRELDLLCQRPFSLQQLQGMWRHISSRCPVMHSRQHQDGDVEEHESEKPLIYLDYYPDLAAKLARAVYKEEKLTLLRGFFFWVQNAEMDGAYRLWVTGQSDDEETVEWIRASGSHSKAINVLLRVDSHEEDTSNRHILKSGTLVQHSAMESHPHKFREG